MLITHKIIDFKLYSVNRFDTVKIHVGILEKQNHAKDRINNKRTCTLSIVVSFVDFKYINNFRIDNKNLYFITETKIPNNKSDILLKEYALRALNKYLEKIELNDDNALVQVNYIINSENKIFKIDPIIKNGKSKITLKHFNTYKNKEEDIYNKELFLNIWSLLSKKIKPI